MPRDRRRRARRRSAGPLLLLSAATLVVLALAVGGVLAVQNASAPYRRSVNRSFADQGSVVADQSSVEGRQLRQLMAELPTLRRSRAQDRLDAMVTATTAQAAAAQGLVPPYPPSGSGPALLSVFDDRATAVSDLRQTIDGLLGLEPLPDVGGPANLGSTGSSGTAGAKSATLISASRAISDLEAVGASLEKADATYATVRHVLATSAGNGQLPRSVWVTHRASWSPGAITALVGQLTSSSSLATSHALELVTVSLAPAAIPPPAGPSPPGGVTTVPPTSTLNVSLVLRDAGNVAEHDVAVTASVREVNSTRAHFHTQRVSLDPGTATAVEFASLPVSPGRTYTLVIGVSSPAAGNTGPSTSYTVAVAPSTPPTTTTSTTRPTPNTGHTATSASTPPTT